MRTEYLIEAATENYRHTWALCAMAANPDYHLEVGDIEICLTDIPSPNFNQIIVKSPLEDPKTTLTQAIGLVEARGKPWSVMVLRGTDPATETFLTSFGASADTGPPHMTMYPIGKPSRGANGLRVEPVVDDEGWRLWIEVSATAFGGGLESFETLFPATLRGAPGLQAFVGWVDGVAIGTSTAIISHSTVGIYSVTTRPDYRRKGYGVQMSWAAVRWGAERGCDVACLQASALGQPVYERMGFEVIGEYLKFSRP